MALTIAGAAAGSAALAAYLDARFHIGNDLSLGSDKWNAAKRFALLGSQIKKGKLLIYHIFEDHTSDPVMGNLTFLMFEGRQWTYKEFYDALQPVGNWLIKELGIEKGEMVALDGGNSPEYLLLWFALEAIGAAVAFINCNLTAQALVHCVKLSKARYLLADSDVRHLVSPVEEELTIFGTKTIYYNPTSISALKDTEPLPPARRADVKPTDISTLVYTSGTTGKPKGTVGSRARQIFLKEVGNKLALKPGMRMYTCLPLYHSSAQAICCLPCIGKGATMVLSRKFSHKTFWPEVRASGASIVQYVGELCRYLLNAPPSPDDRKHNVKMMWGNGMRPDVWEPFRQRFGIDIIYELYAATDGLGFFAHANRGDFSRGAIALRGPLWHLLNGGSQVLVKVTDTQDIIRGSDGFAIRCATNEPGEMMYKLDPKMPVGTPMYFGNPEAGLKRLAKDVFAKGDLWFRTGDSMRMDAEGRLFFVDRLGDTFRWHSENVSTTEVGDVVGAFPQVAEANVYGVLVPNADGRAGCAAVVATEGTSTSAEDIANGHGLDLKGLAEHCLANLPRYAVPIFLRVTKQLEYTGTMKLQKGRLRAEGIDVEAIKKSAKEKGEDADSLYWLPPGETAYVPFRGKDSQELKSGRVRL
ncbi:fatty acid transporter [Hypomontagnella monticulosa]|nr:fatty acid transporter [Hypomontagnella monticulosa]